MWLFENRIKTCCIWCYIECTVPTLNDLNDDGLTPLAHIAPMHHPCTTYAPPMHHPCTTYRVFSYHVSQKEDEQDGEM